MGIFLTILKDYLRDRSLTVLVGGEDFKDTQLMQMFNKAASLDPLMWNIFLDELLQQIPKAVAYADDLIIHLSFSKDNANTSSTRLKRIIDVI